MNIEIILTEYKNHEETGQTLVIRHNSEKNVSLELVEDDRTQNGYIILDLSQLKKALEKMTL